MGNKAKDGDVSRYADIGKTEKRSQAQIESDKEKARKAKCYKGY
jgi:hypothetical protein